MAKKWTCTNTLCKFNNSIKHTCTATKVTIDSNGCTTEERSMQYYINKVWYKLRNTNIIPISDLTEDLKTGLYYVMEIWGLGFTQSERGDWRWVSLCDEDKNPLNYNQITGENRFNGDKYFELLEDYNLNGPYRGDTSEPKIEPKVISQPYGWLSPMGDFYEGDWGTHEEVAWKLVEKFDFEDEYLNWKPDYSRAIRTACDFLSSKGWALIHNPSGTGDYIVTYSTSLTKKQKEYLYGYFMDMGDTFKAEQYLEEE